MLCEGDGWITCHCEEEADEYFIEAVNGDEDSMRKIEEAKQEVSSAGMLLVSDPGWKRLLKEKLIEACKDKNTLKGEKFEDIFKRWRKLGKQRVWSDVGAVVIEMVVLVQAFSCSPKVHMAG